MKWLLQNVRRRAKFAIKNPRYAFGAMVRELTFARREIPLGDHGHFRERGSRVSRRADRDGGIRRASAFRRGTIQETFRG